uniref:Uncharacterized protein n=1 Tax=Lactuca sativa TaxID=4236 RepID=A0A9R1WDT8_LACSA|nr:hypothetical protein LSAT_V11C200091460 [Lactuca sativa]
MGQPSPTQLRDLDGNLVRSCTEYYILPVIRGTGGDLIPDSTRNVSCPLDVVQANHEVNNGMPLTFTPSNVWMLEEYDVQLIVTSHGVAGNPGQETINN